MIANLKLFLLFKKNTDDVKVLSLYEGLFILNEMRENFLGSESKITLVFQGQSGKFQNP